MQKRGSDMNIISMLYTGVNKGQRQIKNRGFLKKKIFNVKQYENFQ